MEKDTQEEQRERERLCWWPFLVLIEFQAISLLVSCKEITLSFPLLEVSRHQKHSIQSV